MEEFKDIKTKVEEKIKDLAEDAEELFDDITEKAEEVIEDLKEDVEEIKEYIQEQIDNLDNKVEEFKIDFSVLLANTLPSERDDRDFLASNIFVPSFSPQTAIND